MSDQILDLMRDAIHAPADHLGQYIAVITDNISSANLKVCQSLISAIKIVIKGQPASPAQRIIALQIQHACMQVGNKDYVNYTGKKLMKRLTAMALHRTKLKNQPPGSDLFGPKSISSSEAMEESAQFYNELLVYLAQWSDAYRIGTNGRKSVFANTFDKMLKKNIVPPSSFPFREKGQQNYAVAPMSTLQDEILNLKDATEPETGDFILVDNIELNLE